MLKFLEFLCMRSEADGVQGHQRVPAALQIGQQLPQEQQELHGGHLRVLRECQGCRVPLCQVLRGAGQMHPGIFRVPLGPCYLPHQLGM